ncbi:hypothetical protein BZA05DRAFT_421637 [Tricharina praecox]|uniref:uncharacterized protein n=1 Tax=Tricharina praecox TaxID=43433 RepID=UPI00221E716B|nr:uncharacterized protein BZA05DRAFT_421637 [Tricharina praecox]KAI5844704.1 hypothetical protein BZA05DRAFT_421637 [Tricharina praecox]
MWNKDVPETCILRLISPKLGSGHGTSQRAITIEHRPPQVDRRCESALEDIIVVAEQPASLKVDRPHALQLLAKALVLRAVHHRSRIALTCSIANLPNSSCRPCSPHLAATSQVSHPAIDLAPLRYHPATVPFAASADDDGDFQHPRVASVLGVPRRYRFPLLVCRGLSIGPSLFGLARCIYEAWNSKAGQDFVCAEVELWLAAVWLSAMIPSSSANPT